MRTKTLLLSGVVAALSSACVMAQVYSLNAVGYINVTVPPNFSIIANQLNTTNNNISPLLDSQLLDGGHDGVQIFKWSAAVQNYVILSVSTAPAWAGAATTTTLNPGEAAFIYNPYSTNMTLTFVGTVLQGPMTNTLLTTFNMVSSMVPQSGALDTDLGLVPNLGDEVYLYSPSTATYETYAAIPSGWAAPIGYPDQTSGRARSSSAPRCPKTILEQKETEFKK